MEIFYSRICGKLLGDGCIIKQKGRQPRFQYSHRVEDFEWTYHCYLLLKDYIHLNAPKFILIKDNRIKKGFFERYIVQSRTDKIITNLETLWYKRQNKTAPISFY